MRLTNAKPVIHQKLPVGTYNLSIDPGGWCLEQRPDFTLPPKIYGGYDKFAQRVIKSHSLLGHGISVLLSGPKGTGKTITAKIIANECQMPVINCQMTVGGPGFASYLESLPNPCLFMFDEFEKVFREPEHRDALLTLLDGTATSRHLFLLTTNDENVGEYFLNRPGRVRYHKRYKPITLEIINEMIDDMMPKGKLKESVKEFVQAMGTITPDQLHCLVQEALLHNETPKEFEEFFNINTGWEETYFDAKMFVTMWAPKDKKPLTEAQEKAYERYQGGALQMVGRGFELPNPEPKLKLLLEKKEMEFELNGGRVFTRKFDHDRVFEGPLMCARVWMNITTGNAHIKFSEDAVDHWERKEHTLHFTLKNGPRFEFTPAAYNPQSKY